MEDITSGRLLPETNLWAIRSICKEVAIRREGDACRLPNIVGMQEEFRTFNIPYKDVTSTDKGKPGDGGKKEIRVVTPRIKVTWSRQGFNLCR